MGGNKLKKKRINWLNIVIKRLHRTIQLNSFTINRHRKMTGDLEWNIRHYITTRWIYLLVSGGLGNRVSSTEKDIDRRLTKAWTAIDKLSIIWKSDLTDKMKRSFFQAAVVPLLLDECTTWTLTKRLEKKLDDNYTRMLRAILNESWRQQPTRHQLYGHLPPPLRKLSKLDESDMHDTAGEPGTSS